MAGSRCSMGLRMQSFLTPYEYVTSVLVYQINMLIPSDRQRKLDYSAIVFMVSETKVSQLVS